MQVLKLNRASLKTAAAILKPGGIVIYPTDTAYGLGGIFDSPEVINKILKIKSRKDEKFTVVAGSLSQAQKFFKLNPAQKKLAKRFWPGPLTIVVSPKFAVRVPANSVARKLCQLVGKPLIATSANISGQPTAYSSRQIIYDFKNKKNQPDLLLDAGRLIKKKTSTIVKVANNKLIILRQGPVVLHNPKK